MQKLAIEGQAYTNSIGCGLLELNLGPLVWVQRTPHYQMN